MTIRLLLVDDHSLFRESVARLLNSEQGFEVVAHCGSVGEAIEVIRSRGVDLVLLDWDLGAEKGSEFIDHSKKAGFAGKVLLVTAGINESDAVELMRKGIVGVFMKHRSPALLVRGIREVMEGKVWFEQDFLKRALEGVSPPQQEGRSTRFTEQERQVLSLVFEGSANKEIADRLHISESSVKSSLQQLFAKTGVRTRSQLVRVVLEHHRDQL
jgi:two-component system nitrate/nitrite response regulator NarL